MIAGVPAGRAPAQFRQGRDAVGAEKLVLDQLASLRCPVMSYKKIFLLLITGHRSKASWSNTSFSASTTSLRCYRGLKAPVRAEPEGYTTGLWPAGATRRASPCHRQWRSKPGCAEGLGTKCGRCTASPALLPPAVASWPRSLKRRWQLLHATSEISYRFTIEDLVFLFSG